MNKVMNKTCPCGSAYSYEKCCQPIHNDSSNALTPEQLMRARYSAHVLNNLEFVIKTYHSSCHAEQQAEAIQESINSHWVKLEVIDTPASLFDTGADEGFVEFKAYFEEDGEIYCLHERSRFIRDLNSKEWRYIDGVMPEESSVDSALSTVNSALKANKAGRNDPCPCGSGKKFKRCCA